MDQVWTCSCGCGQQVAKENSWAPGHDHRAIHTRITRDHGNVAAFIDWYDKLHNKKALAAATRAQNKSHAHERSA